MVTKEQVAEIYVATFDRAPDTAGLDYWVDTGMAIEHIAESFFDQDETREKYPDTLSDSEFVNTIYENVYNRGADPDGLTYWVNALESGSTSRANMIIAMVNGAQGTDQDILDNKTEVGLYFADKGALLSYNQSVEIMEDVTSNENTVDDAKAQVDIWSTNAQTIPLTTGVDNIEGTDLDNMITALVASNASNNTLNPEDTIDGGGGDNTLLFTNEASTATTTAISHMSSVGTLAYINSTTADQTVDLAGTTGVVSITMDGSGTARSSFKNVLDIVDLELNGSSSTRTSVSYTAATIVGDNDTMNISNNTESRQTVNIQGVETINLTSGTQAGVSNEITISDADLYKIVVDGAGAMTISANGAVAEVINLSAATGNITIDQNIVSVEGARIISGGGADSIHLSGGNDIVVYTQADQSQAANRDMIIGFSTGLDSIKLTRAIEDAGGDALDRDASGKFDNNLAGPMAIGQDFDGNVVMVDRDSDIAYIDVNTDGKFDANDMLIDLGAAASTIEATDFII
ncbi:MAG: DUF4214 domain-containing protein [Campylobacterota bacterium]|nr:DUF4214 domain-containing protein [Campylobacterota bacterium]